MAISNLLAEQRGSIGNGAISIHLPESNMSGSAFNWIMEWI